VLAHRHIRYNNLGSCFALLIYPPSEHNTKLYRAYLHEPGAAVSRPRGKSPQQCTFFTRSPRLKEESSFTSVSRQALANLSRGELLCQAFEVYHDLVADPHISFEQLVFLVCALAEGEELTLASCEDCGALTVDDRIFLKARQCLHCAKASN
jgi:hypothetical protein